MGKVDKKKQYKNNPRQISEKQLADLQNHLEELGDLSGVVYCKNNKAYVGGNQRSKIFDGAEIEIIETFKRPTKTHTTAHGYITYKGEKYTYREVNFDSDQFNKACIVANSAGGEWDTDKLKDWKKEDLIDWGVKLEDWNAEEENDNTTSKEKDLSNSIEVAYKVEVNCNNESEQEILYNKLTEEGYECRILTL